jgi:hypothetical protein
MYAICTIQLLISQLVAMWQRNSNAYTHVFEVRSSMLPLNTLRYNRKSNSNMAAIKPAIFRKTVTKFQQVILPQVKWNVCKKYGEI